MITKASPDDILRWADGTWCYREQLHEYPYLSDDFEVINAGSPEWDLMTGATA